MKPSTAPFNSVNAVATTNAVVGSKEGYEILNRVSLNCVLTQIEQTLEPHAYARCDRPKRLAASVRISRSKLSTYFLIAQLELM
jgi:hypothetical protein